MIVSESLEKFKTCLSEETIKLMNDFLQSKNIVAGKHYLDGEDLYASVDEYSTAKREERFFEAHFRYVDIQTLLEGRELCGWAPLSLLEYKREEYKERDIAFFEKPENYTTVFLKPSVFVLFDVNDGHMPCLSVSETSEKVKKIVFKIDRKLIKK